MNFKAVTFIAGTIVLGCVLTACGSEQTTEAPFTAVTVPAPSVASTGVPSPTPTSTPAGGPETVPVTPREWSADATTVNVTAGETFTLSPGYLLKDGFGIVIQDATVANAIAAEDAGPSDGLTVPFMALKAGTTRIAFVSVAEDGQKTGRSVVYEVVVSD